MDKDIRIAELEAKVEDYRAALEQGNQDLVIAFQLTPKLAQIFGLLVSMRLVTNDMLENKLGVVQAPRIAMSRLRVHMKEFGIEIQSRRRVGYWLTPETKELVRELVSKLQNPGNSPD